MRNRYAGRRNRVTDQLTEHERVLTGVGLDVKVRAFTQSLIAVSIVGVWLLLNVTTGEANQGITGIAGGVVGWYFRGVIVQNGATKP